MKVHSVVQGTQEWLALRFNYKTASEASASVMDMRLRRVEQESPGALIARIEESERDRAEDGRSLDRHLERLTKGLREVMAAVSEIRTVLKLPTV